MHWDVGMKLGPKRGRQHPLNGNHPGDITRALQATLLPLGRFGGLVKGYGNVALNEWYCCTTRS